jgi:hypothetical protein
VRNEHLDSSSYCSHCCLTDLTVAPSMLFPLNASSAPALLLSCAFDDIGKVA